MNGPVLVSWRFNYRWCYNGTNVTSLTSNDDLTIYSAAIQVTGTKAHTVGALPAPNVRDLWQGINFKYCPITSPGGANCIAEFHPKIDIYFSRDGTLLNVSTG